jgi:undecaprenyl-diphosphatase
MTPNRKQRFAAMVILGGTFAILLVLVWNGGTDAFDMALRNWALGFNTPTIVAVWEGISLMGSVAVLSGLTFLSIGLFAMRRDWPAVRQIALAMGGAVALDTISKWMVHRPRPDEVYAHTMPASYSFPSGHALYSLTFYMSIAIVMSRNNRGRQTKAIWSTAVLLSALIGASRVFLGVHYGSDVLGGYLIASVWLMLVSVPAAAERSLPPHHSLR